MSLNRITRASKRRYSAWRMAVQRAMGCHKLAETTMVWPGLDARVPASTEIKTSSSNIWRKVFNSSNRTCLNQQLWPSLMNTWLGWSSHSSSKLSSWMLISQEPGKSVTWATRTTCAYKPCSPNNKTSWCKTRTPIPGNQLALIAHWNIIQALTLNKLWMLMLMMNY